MKMIENRMVRKFFWLMILFMLTIQLQAQFPRFKMLAFYSTKVEKDHVDFAKAAIFFFKDLTKGNGFVFDTTSNMADLNDEKLKDYSVVMMINDFPHSPAQRAAFEKYMENGGGWFGFHVAAYNDKSTKWPWLLDFLGGGVFYRNNWPPMPAKLLVDDQTHDGTKGLPETFVSPINEWYHWNPSPRERKNIKVLVSLSPENYPLGLTDIVPDGDLPVVWTNTDYRMIYMNMGHDENVFGDATQDMLIINGLRWIVASDRKGNVFEKK